MRALSSLVGSRRSAWTTLLLAVLTIGVLFALLPTTSTESSPQAGLPESSQAAQVAELLAGFPSADATVGLLVFSRQDGTKLGDADLTAVGERAVDLANLSSTPQAVQPQVSADGTVALIAVPLNAPAQDAAVDELAVELRSAASADLPEGLEARLTGPVGFQADIRGAFAGADLRLLLVTVAVVAVLLLITYRSPLLWLIPLVVVGIADGLSRFVVTWIADVWNIPVDASIAGILSVLVFGAGTNYALLLVARYREELRNTADRFAAMRTAVSAAGPAIVASGGTVTLSLLVLLFAELAGNRALGVACAIGIVIAMIFALAVLPAALVVCGRGVFWPFVPRPGAGADRPGFWERIGTGVRRRPAAVAAVATLGLGVLMLGLGGYRVGLPQLDQFVGEPESVVGQKLLQECFPDAGSPTVTVLARDGVAEDAASMVSGTAGVASATTGESAGGLTRIDVVLDADAGSDGAFATVTALRQAYAGGQGELGATLVGGPDATALDARESAQRDLLLVAPMILGIVFLVLVLLLRSLLAPALLLLTVLASFFASLGASTWLFSAVLGYDALDVSVTLYAFLFLVALGVDYNIFLTTRAREERERHGTRPGMVRALGATGAVITSAGVLLAAVFAVLGVLPVVALLQVGVIVCIGVLLDTLVVRTLLVPALVFLTGDRFWWPWRAKPAGGPRVGSDLATGRQALRTPTA